MAEVDTIRVGEYGRRCGLRSALVGIKETPAAADINAAGLMMHGSVADPYTILKFGLATQQTLKNSLEREWQICLGLSAKGPGLTVKKDLARKNSAIKYADNFERSGTVYLISDKVKRSPTYKEYWDTGESGRGYAWLNEAIKAEYITGIITEDLTQAAAAIAATDPEKPLYRPDGRCYKVLLIG